jgi:hypothetical protein
MNLTPAEWAAWFANVGPDMDLDIRQLCWCQHYGAFHGPNDDDTGCILCDCTTFIEIPYAESFLARAIAHLVTA